MPVDVLYNMEIKICLKKSAKPKRERKKERGGGASRGQLEARILVSPAHSAFQMEP